MPMVRSLCPVRKMAGRLEIIAPEIFGHEIVEAVFSLLGRELFQDRVALGERDVRRHLSP